MKMDQTTQNLIELAKHYKNLADFQFSRGNFEEAKVYDSRAYEVDTFVMENMIANATIE
jgi:hypothetical protein